MLTSQASATLPRIDSTYLCEYILTKVEQFGPVSHLKLQKLLYYVQAYHLAYFEVPVIDDNFQAWVHGPVSRKIYDEIRDLSILHTSIKYTQNPGDVHPNERIPQTLSVEQVEFIDDILSEFGSMSSYALENLTHSEEPWIRARKGYGPADRCENTLDNDFMMGYYKQFLYEGQD